MTVPGTALPEGPGRLRSAPGSWEDLLENTDQKDKQRGLFEGPRSPSSPALRCTAVGALLRPFPLKAEQSIYSEHLSKIKAEPSFKCSVCT